GSGKRIEAGHHGDVESAVAGEQRGMGAIQLQAFAVGQEHGNFGAVLGGVPDLSHFIFICGDGDFVLEPNGLFSRGYVIAIDAGRNVKRVESVETLVVVPASAETRESTQSRRFDLADELAIWC